MSKVQTQFDRPIHTKIKFACRECEDTQVVWKDADRRGLDAYKNTKNIVGADCPRCVRR